jgi:hypothetical protein
MLWLTQLFKRRRFFSRYKQERSQENLRAASDRSMMRNQSDCFTPIAGRAKNVFKRHISFKIIGAAVYDDTSRPSSRTWHMRTKFQGLLRTMHRQIIIYPMLHDNVFSYGRITVTTYADCRQGKTTLRPVRRQSFYLTAARKVVRYIENQVSSSDPHRVKMTTMTNELFKRTSAS